MVSAGEMRDEKKLLTEENERRAADSKRQIDTLEEQLQAAKERERDLIRERDDLSRTHQVWCRLPRINRDVVSGG